MKDRIRPGDSALQSRLGLVLVLVLASCGGGDTPHDTATLPPSSDLPNILLILLDDAGYGDYGDAADDSIPTPRLDHFASEATVFTRAYANAPVCSPSRAALLTGHHPVRYGIRRGIGRRGIPERVVTLPEWLRDRGYATAHIGKWHLGKRKPAFLPPAQGFTHSVTSAEVKRQDGGSYFDPVLRIDGAEIVRPKGHQTPILTDYALAYLREHRDEPFFLNLWYRAPHQPVEPPVAWASRFPDSDEGRYAALMAATDEQIGRVLDLLDELGIADHTLVIVTSDNGGVRTSSRTGLRGGKAGLFEGGIRVPLLVRWPDRAVGGRRNASLVAGFDLFPTLAEILGGDISHLGLDGQSFLQALVDGAHLSRASSLVWEIREALAAPSIPDGRLDTWAILRDDKKLLHSQGRTRLFDLAIDPGERRDVATSHPILVKRLTAEYRDWRLRLPRIPIRDFQTSGEVTRLGPFDEPRHEGWLLEGPGRVALAPDSLFDFVNADFSFAIRITPETASPPLVSEAIIARKAGSWDLRLDADRRVLLRMFESEERQLELRSRSAVPPGREVQVAFTVLGFRMGDSVVRLFLGGKLEAEAMEIRFVRPGDATIELGSEELPFRGRLRDLRIYAACLSPEELRSPGGTHATRDDPEGVPD